MTTKMKANASLIFVTLSWGISFILAKNALSAFPVFQYLALRFLIAFVITSILFRQVWKAMNRTTFFRGLGLGVLLFAGFGIQTLGLNYTTVSKSAFITGLSIVLVPLVLAVKRRQMPSLKTFFSTGVASIGLALITLFGSGHGGATSSALQSINIGDGLTLIGALFFALHIVGVEQASDSEPLGLAVVQIGTVGMLSLMISLGLETQTMPQDLNIWGQLVFLAIFCTAMAYVVQNIAQQHTSAEVTALIYAFEPAFAALFGWILLGEVLSTVGIFGALLILLGTLINEIKNPLINSLE